MRTLLRSPAGAKDRPESTSELHKGPKPEKRLDESLEKKPTFIQNVLGSAFKAEQPKAGSEKRQEGQPESETISLADPPERDSPKSRQLELLDVSELSFIARKLVRELPVETAYFLLDGVDECNRDEQRSLTSAMLKLWDVEPGKFKRRQPADRWNGHDSDDQARGPEQTAGDIEKFISTSVKQLENIDGFKAIQQEVEQILLKGSEGTFLWVNLIMQEIEKKKTFTEILAAIKDIPQGLNNKYNHMLQQFDPVRKQQVYQIMRWVTAAIRPLTIHELSAVVDAPSSAVIPPEQNLRDLITSAEGLLKVQGDEVTLIHASARDFLLSANNEGAPESYPIGLEELHYEVAQVCYSEILHSGLSQPEMRVSELSDREETRLLKYAIIYWMEHVKASDWAAKNFDPNAEFFRKDSKLRKNWWTAYLEDSQNDDPKNFNVTSLLHLAAYFGMAVWMKQAFEGKAWIAKKGIILMELDYYHRTALHIAVEQGHRSVVSLLLDQGVEIEYREASLFATPLHLAARNGHQGICKILLDHKARINARNRFYSTPLTEAARGGHLEVVKLLVEQGADINGSIEKKQKSLFRQIEICPAMPNEHSEKSIA